MICVIGSRMKTKLISPMASIPIAEFRKKGLVSGWGGNLEKFSFEISCAWIFKNME
jgi:hypothetical protein